MLGPADEFGQRLSFSPRLVTIHADGFFAEAPTLPELTQYRRNESSGSTTLLGHLPQSDEDPSFLVDQSDDPFEINISSTSISVSPNNSRLWNAFSGVEIEFQSLLEAGLDSSTFESENNLPLENSIWPFFAGELPDVAIVVNYQSSGTLSLLGGSFTLLAVPQVLGSQAVVPEPTTITMALASLAVMLSARWARSVVGR